MLNRYLKEVDYNKTLFEKGKEHLDKGNGFLVISKNKPSVAGSIAWARSIFYRIKRPIIKFLTKEDDLDPVTF